MQHGAANKPSQIGVVDNVHVFSIDFRGEGQNFFVIKCSCLKFVKSFQQCFYITELDCFDTECLLVDSLVHFHSLASTVMNLPAYH